MNVLFFTAGGSLRCGAVAGAAGDTGESFGTTTVILRVSYVYVSQFFIFEVL